MPQQITKATIDAIIDAIQKLFLADQIPWVIGYSGGKDSTAVLQLVWSAIYALPKEERLHKTIHVINTDTLVEQPIVAAWVKRSLARMLDAAEEQGMPMVPHRLTPKTHQTYWVNLIGRGYPAPRKTFRWCTSRLKIDPSNSFILDMVRNNGETILVLGTRKAESVSRAQIMNRYEQQRIRGVLSPNGSLANSWVFTPIESWSNDDVWLYLMQYRNPWGWSNKELLSMYRGASADNECPLVLDTTTPSCGSSRFGCWVCTLVSADKSMQAMIQNDEEKAWMIPLLEFRNDLGKLDADGKIDDRDKRDFRRMDGSIKLKDGRAIHGPYTKQWRENLLRRLLEVQNLCRSLGAPDIKLINDEELQEIRRIWVHEKRQFDDSLPSIYEEVTCQPYPYRNDLRPGPFGAEQWRMLEDLCRSNPLHLELVTSVLDIEQRLRGLAVRRGIYDSLEKIVRRCYFVDESDALTYAKKRHEYLQLSQSVTRVSFLAATASDDDEGGFE